MQTRNDSPIPEMRDGFFWIPVMTFQFGLMELLAPLNEGLCPLRRLRGLCIVLLGTPLAVVGMLLLPLLTFVLFSLSALWMYYTGETAQFSSEGVVVCSRRRGCIARLDWTEIDSMRKRWDVPFARWEIVPCAGDALSVPMVSESVLIAACRANHVPLWREDRATGMFVEM